MRTLEETIAYDNISQSHMSMLGYISRCSFNN